MKKITLNLFLALLLLTGVQKIRAQLVSNYLFTSSVSVYANITGGTVLGNNNNDEDIFDHVPIGFSFNYGSGTFTQVSVSANGYIKMGGVLNNTTPFNAFYWAPISDTGSDDSIISIMGCDLASNTNGSLRYRTNGTAPNRVFIVQWRSYGSFSSIDTMNFQIRLHETSNQIEFDYGNYYVDSYNTYEIGLRGILASNDFNNRTVINGTNTWSTSTAGVTPADYCELDPGPPQFKPVNGQKYVWDAPPPCSGPPNAGATSGPTIACVGQVLNLNLTGSTNASGLTYQWQSSPNAVTWASVSTPTNVPAFYPTYTTNIYYRCIVACGTNTALSTSLYIIPQSPNTYATVPFLENFDNTWQDRCGGTRNVPVAANWTSYPVTGNNSWRRQDDGISANWATSSGTNTPLAGIGCADFSTYDALAGMTGDMDLYVNLGTTTNYQMSFYYINMSGDDSLYVLLSTDGGATFTNTTAFTSGDNNSNDLNWNKKIINLGAVNSNSCVVRFHAISDWGIDDIGMDSLQIKTSCAAPSLTLAASQVTACSGASVSLTASGATSYTWSTLANTSSIVVTPTTTTTYTVSGQNSPGCPGTKTISIAVTPGPAINFSVSPSPTICPGGSANITATGAANYTWSAGSQTTAAISVTPGISTVYNVVGTNSSGCSTNTNVTIFVTICTGLNTVAAIANDVKVYPNPTSGEFVVELANGLSKDIQVFDVTGRLVLNESTLQDKATFNLNNLTAGVYYVRIKSNNTVDVTKVIKE